MLYGIGVSGYSVSLRTKIYLFLFESVILQGAERQHFPLLVFDCLFADVVSFTDLPIKADKNGLPIKLVALSLPN